MLISVFPMLAVYGYHAYNHYERDESFYIHRPDDSLSAAENILRMLRPNKEYTNVEARVLVLALVLHMEHGGGNNSTFSTRVVTSDRVYQMPDDERVYEDILLLHPHP